MISTDYSDDTQTSNYNSAIQFEQRKQQLSRADNRIKESATAEKIQK